MKCQFTRDYSYIKHQLSTLDDHDKTCIEAAFKTVNQIVLEEWGSNTTCQILLITDGNVGVGQGSLQDSFNRFYQGGSTFPLPFSFPAKLNIVCLSSPTEPALLRSKPLYQKLIKLCSGEGSLIIPDELSEPAITSLFQKLGDEMYTTFKSTLKFGNLQSPVYLSPPPIAYTKISEFGRQTYTLSETLDVVGFIAVADIGSPMGVGRHLIQPTIASPKDAQLKQDAEVEDVSDEENTPSFGVLFHGALKVENMVALVNVADDWFGFIYSWPDSKKKSILMLTLLAPGADAVPWLGDLNNVHCYQGVIQEILLNFPFRAQEKRSYSQNGVVWIRLTGLQSDIQKILRHAKKLPEKTIQFYKELNRLRKAAVQLGFMELLSGLAEIFEQEVAQLPSTANSDIALQLTHAAAQLNRTLIRDNKLIMPIQPRRCTIVIE